MLEFSRNILLLSLIISGITAGLVYFALHRLIVRPVRRLSGNIAAFAGDRGRLPRHRALAHGATRSASPNRRSPAWRRRSRRNCAKKRHLAELGLAVSKINHELRNMLTTAQLLTDRLEGVPDPAVQRVAPRLLTTLGRAIDFCEATLAYGRAKERLPQRRRMRLKPLVDELMELTDLAPGAAIAFAAHVPDDLEVDADPDQLSRVLVNLVRNAVQALSQAGASDGPPRIEVSAFREGRAVRDSSSQTTGRACRRARGKISSQLSKARGAPAVPGWGSSFRPNLSACTGGALARRHGGRRALSHRHPRPERSDLGSAAPVRSPARPPGGASQSSDALSTKADANSVRTTDASPSHGSTR